MSDQSAVEWTDATWNPVRGCVKVSPGCKHCYAETFAERFRGVKGHPYEQGFDLRLVPEKLNEPLSWKKPRRVFVNSMSDLFQDGVPDEFIDRVFAVMALAPQHTFQVLTKRPERMREYLIAASDRWGDRRGDIEQAMCDLGGDNDARTIIGWPLLNVWLGVSVENQKYADERIPWLLATPAAARFISAEPLLGATDISRYLPCAPCVASGAEQCVGGTKLDWVIVGGESGPGARPFDVAWARSIVAQCQAAGVACFVKQLGARAYGPDVHSAILHHKKGGDMAEWPQDLRIRQFPEAQS